MLEPSKIFKALSNPINLKILTLLRSSSFHPRELARILNRDETDISRRLRQLERLGLIKGKWERVDGKNVRVYSLKVSEIRIFMHPTKLEVKVGENESYEAPIEWESSPRVEVFVGRKRELSIIRNAKGVVVIYGITGIGKTSLAAKAFPNAYWYNVTGLEDFKYFAWQLGLFLSSIGFEDLLEYLRGGGNNENDIFKLITEGIEKTGAIIIIDDFHKFQDEKVNYLLSYLAPRIKKGKVIITTRIRPNLGNEGVTYVNLKGLNPEEAYSLAREKEKSMTPEEFAKLYKLTFGHPLMLNLILESSEILATGKDTVFNFLFEEVYQMLNEEEKDLLSILSLFDEPIEYEGIKFLYDRNPFVPLYSLMKKGLIEKKGEKYFVHDMVREFVREVSNQEEKEVYLRHVNFLLKSKTPINFLRAFKYAIKVGSSELIRNLVELRVKEFYRIIVDFPRMYQRLLMEVEDNPYAKIEIAIIEVQRGLFEKAIKLLKEAEPYVDEFFKCEIYSWLADAYMELENLEKAERYLKKTKEIVEKINDMYAWFSYYAEKTKYEYYKENSREALKSALKELEIIRKIGDPEKEGLVLLHVGDIYLHMGNYEKGISYYQEALKMAKAYGIKFLEHISYMELAKGYYQLKLYEKASEYSEKAANYFLMIRNYRRATDAMAYGSVSYIATKNLEKAEKFAKEMIRIAQSTDYPLAWAGYIFLAAVDFLKGDDWREDYNLGKAHLKEYPWLFEAVLDELKKVFDLSNFK